MKGGWVWKKKMIGASNLEGERGDTKYGEEKVEMKGWNDEKKNNWIFLNDVKNW